MLRAALILFTLGALAVAASTCAQSARASAVYWIDYDRGDDNADGLTKRTAWKHLPGDAAAQGVTARNAPSPGDRFMLVAGSRYRGSVQFEFSGENQAPITISGESGGQPAVIDGSDPILAMAPCRSAAECGNAPGWKRLTRISLAARAEIVPILFSDAGPLHEAQSPNPTDSFYGDEVSDFLTVDGQDLADGRLTLPPAVAATLDRLGTTRIVIWARSNRVEERPLIAADGARISFDPSDVNFYTDRPSRIAFRGGVGQIDQPGEYSLLPDRRTVIAYLPNNAGRVSASNGRGGIDVSGSRNVVIRNIVFERFADDGENIRTGIGISAQRKPLAGLVVEDNHFRDFVSRLGQGAIIIQGASDLVIRRNSIANMQFGSGMRLGSSNRVKVTQNRISRIGRTGIMVMNCSDVEVASNRIHDVLGLHGNGLSAYLGNRNVRFVANTVYDAKQPVTFHGSKAGGPSARNIVFLHNVFIATDQALGSLISWDSDGVAGVKISNNVILGGAKVALRLSSLDRSVTISNNVIAGLSVDNGIPQGWTIRDNGFTRVTGGLLPAGNREISPVPIGPGGAIDPAAVCSTITQPSPDTEAASSRALGATSSCS